MTTTADRPRRFDAEQVTETFAAWARAVEQGRFVEATKCAAALRRLGVSVVPLRDREGSADG